MGLNVRSHYMLYIIRNHLARVDARRSISNSMFGMANGKVLSSESTNPKVLTSDTSTTWCTYT